jgi:hypothetical protein
MPHSELRRSFAKVALSLRERFAESTQNDVRAKRPSVSAARTAQRKGHSGARDGLSVARHSLGLHPILLTNCPLDLLSGIAGAHYFGSPTSDLWKFKSLVPSDCDGLYSFEP